MSDEDELSIPGIVLLFPPLALIHGPYVRLKDWMKRRKRILQKVDSP